MLILFCRTEFMVFALLTFSTPTIFYFPCLITISVLFATHFVTSTQTILSSKPEGDSKLTELRRQSQSLSDQEDLEENTRQEAEQTVKDSEEQWRTVLQTAENTLKKAEVQYSLSREMEVFCTQAGNTKTWVKELQQKADSKGKGTHGSKVQIEDRLNTAQVKHSA